MTRGREAPEKTVARLMKKTGFTLCAAESCTGGLLSHKITNVSGSSKYFMGGIIAYSNAVKTDILHVPREILRRAGAVSRETASAMAQGAKKRFGCDISIATTGIAGPTGGSREKPVGTVFIAIAGKTGEMVEGFLFKGKREDIKLQTANKALDMLKEFLSTGPKP